MTVATACRRLLLWCAVAGLAAGLLAGPAAAGTVEVLPVPATTIYPGDVISDEMLADGRFSPGTSARYPVVAERSELVGKVARRTLRPGRLIARNTVGEPELIQKGRIIPAVYSHGALTITTSVLALQSGSVNDAIQARNIDSGKVIVGIVTADGGLWIDGQ